MIQLASNCCLLSETWFGWSFFEHICVCLVLIGRFLFQELVGDCFSFWDYLWHNLTDGQVWADFVEWFVHCFILERHNDCKCFLLWKIGVHTFGSATILQKKLDDFWCISRHPGKYQYLLKCGVGMVVNCMLRVLMTPAELRNLLTSYKENLNLECPISTCAGV